MQQASGSRPYELFMLGLSGYAVTAFFAQALLAMSETAQHVLAWADVGVCAVFFVDFVRSVRLAPSRSRYLLTWGWLDLLSSIPILPWHDVARLARITRILRVLRAARSAKNMAVLGAIPRAAGTAYAAALALILLLVFSSIAVLLVETAAGSNIRTAADALWWAFSTVTTVGYGDHFPVTGEGRLIAVVLMVAGFGLFGVLSAFLATWFMAPGEKQQNEQLIEVRRDLAEIKELLRQGRRDNA
jgi:voltage-gated potassium channel